MPTRNVVLTAHQEEVIEALVTNGRYQNASEVLREGLRMVEQREAEDAARLEALRKAATFGLEALERGEFRDFDNADDLAAYLDEVTEQAIASAADQG